LAIARASLAVSPDSDGAVAVLHPVANDIATTLIAASPLSFVICATPIEFKEGTGWALLLTPHHVRCSYTRPRDVVGPVSVDSSWVSGMEDLNFVSAIIGR